MAEILRLNRLNRAFDSLLVVQSFPVRCSLIADCVCHVSWVTSAVHEARWLSAWLGKGKPKPECHLAIDLMQWQERYLDEPPKEGVPMAEEIDGQEELTELWAKLRLADTPSARRELVTRAQILVTRIVEQVHNARWVASRLALHGDKASFETKRRAQAWAQHYDTGA